MTIKILIPTIFGKCTLAECPAGLFAFWSDGDKDPCIAFKTEYGSEPPYIVASGEVFWGGAKTPEDRDKLLVQPLKIRDITYEGPLE